MAGMGFPVVPRVRAVFPNSGGGAREAEEKKEALCAVVTEWAAEAAARAVRRSRYGRRRRCGMGRGGGRAMGGGGGCGAVRWSAWAGWRSAGRFPTEDRWSGPVWAGHARGPDGGPRPSDAPVPDLRRGVRKKAVVDSALCKGCACVSMLPRGAITLEKGMLSWTPPCAWGAGSAPRPVPRGLSGFRVEPCSSRICERRMNGQS